MMYSQYEESGRHRHPGLGRLNSAGQPQNQKDQEPAKQNISGPLKKWVRTPWSQAMDQESKNLKNQIEPDVLLKTGTQIAIGIEQPAECEWDNA